MQWNTQSSLVTVMIDSLQPHWLHTACHASLSSNSWSLFKLMSIVSDAIQPSHYLLSPSPPALSLSQHQLHRLQHTSFPCPSTPRACWNSNSSPLSRWCHPTLSSSVGAFSSCLQSFPASGYFPVSQFFASGGQRIGVSASASVFPRHIQDWFPLGLTGLISL